MKRLFLFMMMYILFAVCVAEAEVVTVASYEEYYAELMEAERFTDDQGRRLIRVELCYTNESANGMYILESFVIKAYQGNVQLADCTDINEEIALIQEVKNGATISAGYTFEVVNDEPVEIRLFTPTADEVLLAQKEY